MTLILHIKSTRTTLILHFKSILALSIKTMVFCSKSPHGINGRHGLELDLFNQTALLPPPVIEEGDTADTTSYEVVAALPKNGNNFGRWKEYGLEDDRENKLEHHQDFTKDYDSECQFEFPPKKPPDIPNNLDDRDYEHPPGLDSASLSSITDSFHHPIYQQSSDISFSLPAFTSVISCLRFIRFSSPTSTLSLPSFPAFLLCL